MMTGIETEVVHNLHILEKKGILEVRKIILFGASDYSYILAKILEHHGYKVSAIIDNNKYLHNLVRGGKIKIWYTEKFFEQYDDSYIFLLMSGYYDEMKNQLESHGYVDHVHIFQMAKVVKSDLWHALNDTRMDLYLKQIKEGQKLHEKLLKEYGRDIRIMLFCGSSIGDVYVMGFYIKEYLKTNSKCLFIFGKLTLKELAEELGFGQVLYMQEDEIWTLIKFAEVCGFDKVNIEHLHVTVGVHFRIAGRMLNYIGYTWMPTYREVFELPDNIKPDIQRLYSHNDVEEYFGKYGLAKGKTVVLAPNAKSFPLLENEFWESLAQKLLESGYSVCTNIGSKYETGISGTVPVFIPLNDMQKFVEKAGYFIALRSGLCDILCCCDCKKILLYNFIADINENEIKFFSLQNMWFDKKTLEYGINQKNRAEILDQILKELPPLTPFETKG